MLRKTTIALACAAALALPACGGDDDDTGATTPPPTTATPTTAADWARLAEQRYKTADEKGGFSVASSEYTAKGKARLRAAAAAWRRHLELAGDNPDGRLARDMVGMFSEGGLGDYRAAVEAQQVLIKTSANEPRSARSALQAQLAVLYYEAKDARNGDRAVDRAVELAAASRKKGLRASMERIRKRLGVR